MTAKTVIAIRTHRWDEDAARLYAALVSVPAVEVVIAFHNRPEGLALPAPVIDLNDDWLRARGLRVLSDWGWRCGDYFLYALREARLDADFLWLVEPDVHFTAPPADFFGLFNGVEADLLGVRVEPMDPGHRFTRGLPGMAHWRAIFALTRFSGPAADRLFALRRAYSAGPTRPRFFANDEAFCFSHAVAEGMSVASMADLAPDWLPEGQVATDPDILYDMLASRQGPGVWHPVRSRASFIGAVAGRAGQNFAFFNAMRESLAQLAPDEREAIADQVRSRCLQALGQVTGDAASHPET